MPQAVPAGTTVVPVPATTASVSRASTVPGPRSTTRREPAPRQGLGDHLGPVDRVDENGDSQVAGQAGVQPGALGPRDDVLDGGREQRGVEGDRGGEELGDGAEDRSPAAALPNGIREKNGLKAEFTL